ncbi:MAG: T9SS C-terminal target domain-containing protein, partial [Saprospirales bacterium]
GDTCSARLIPVIPVGDGERLIIEGQEENQSEVIAYPIPFRDEVILKYRLQNKNTDFRVFDSTGKIIATGTLNDTEGEQIIDTRKWIPGWYLLEVIDKTLNENIIVLVKK